MPASAKPDWLIPVGLIALSIVPLAAGVFRVMQLGGGAEITPDNARFFAAPAAVILHVVSTLIYCLLGAFQFAPGLRHRNPGWHRGAGRMLIPWGLVAALTGLWMTQFNLPAGHDPTLPASFDGPSLYPVRILAGSAMALFLCLGFAAIRRRDFAGHQGWMMRAYALALGAGTQVFTHIPWFLLPGIRGQLARTLCMAAGWAINVAVAEWLIARQHRRRLAARPA